MAGFPDVTKYLGRTFARKSTDADLQSSQSLPDPLKYTKRSTARAVKNVPYSFTIPSTTASLGLVYGGFPPHYYAIVCQFNCTLPYQFRILNAGEFASLTSPVIGKMNAAFACVRYRVGNVAHRYLISNRNNVDFLIPQYTNQIIKPNFCIELWDWASVQVQLLQDFTFDISLIATPQDGDTKSINQNALVATASNVLAGPLPMALVGNTFTPDPAGAWLDNP